ncbi:MULTISPECIES: MoaD/ThiS family protein [Alphaproteobacteria]|jgi:molybdopterin converting factor small subunit|uniref:MoaD/ThiS family protein n=1 Tax=Alphaproteobacteria TaxID=28211 RepID=UPI00329A46D1
MAVTVRFFAALRDKAGCTSLDVEDLPEPPTIDALAAQVSQRGALGDALMQPTVRVILNGAVADRAALLCDHDEVAFCPPFSGG